MRERTRQRTCGGMRERTRQRTRGGNGMRYAFAALNENNMEGKLDSMIQGVTDDFPR
jgi:hypothetical protein